MWSFVSIAAGLFGFAAFALQQRRHAARGGKPLVSPGIFGRRSYTVVLGGIALYFAGAIGIQLVFTLFLQLGQSFSAGQAGLGGIPLALGAAIGGGVSGALLADKLGRAVLQIGTLVQVAGAAALWLTLEKEQTFSLWHLAPGLFTAGIGSGLVVAALFNIVVGSVADDEVGSASGVLSAVQSIAAAVGVALLGTVFFSRALAGDAGAGFRTALLVQGILLVVFLVISPLFPTRARPEGPPLEIG